MIQKLANETKLAVVLHLSLLILLNSMSGKYFSFTGKIVPMILNDSSIKQEINPLILSRMIIMKDRILKGGNEIESVELDDFKKLICQNVSQYDKSWEDAV